MQRGMPRSLFRRCAATLKKSDECWRKTSAFTQNSSCLSQSFHWRNEARDPSVEGGYDGCGIRAAVRSQTLGTGQVHERYHSRPLRDDLYSFRAGNLCPRSLAVLIITLALGSACRASEFLLSDFVEMNKEKMEATLPSFAAAFPDARFHVGGFSASSGEWQFIRAESISSCSGDICPTLLVHRAVDWKVLVYAKKQIRVSINYEHGG